MPAVDVSKLGGPKSGKFRAMLQAYVGEACLNATKAAEMAGYSECAKRASALKRRYREVFEAADVAFRESLSMGAQEATEALAAIARNPKHKDQFNATKTLLTMHGKLDPTLNVKLSRSELNKSLDELLSQLAESRSATATNALPEPVSEDPPKQSSAH